MAVHTPGAAAPIRPVLGLPALASNPTQTTPLRTRTRRLHALFALAGDTAASVHSTRRSEQQRGVILALNSGEQAQSIDMLPTEARALACALLSAAEALELVNRWPSAASAKLAQGGGA
jgi:hypothetical protein